MSRVKTSLDHKKFRCLIWLVIVFVLLGYSLQNVVGSIYYSMVVQSYGTVTSPPVILRNGTAGNNIIYTNNTNALVTVEAPMNNSANLDYVLIVVNQIVDNWTVNLKVYDSFNIGRLSSLNISFHDGISSNQIAVSGGNIVKSEGSPYNLAGITSIYIAMNNLEATSIGTSYIYVHLKILVPNTSTYMLYVITFEII